MGIELADPKAVLQVAVFGEFKYGWRYGQSFLAGGHPGDSLALSYGIGQFLINSLASATAGTAMFLFHLFVMLNAER